MRTVSAENTNINAIATASGIFLDIVIHLLGLRNGDIIQRIHLASVNADLKMTVRAEGVAGFAGVSDRLPLINRIAG